MYPRLDMVDRQIAGWMERYGHMIHRVSLGVFFAWLGVLKTFGVSTATSLIAHVIYWGPPEVIVPIIGWWEITIGVCLIIRPLVRIALLLLVIRLPGSLLALLLLLDVCFVHVPYAPTLEGQYLIKDIMLFSAALVIGGTIRFEKDPRVYH